MTSSTANASFGLICLQQRETFEFIFLQLVAVGFAFIISMRDREDRKEKN
jgi:hypothetical protein